MTRRRSNSTPLPRTPNPMVRVDNNPKFLEITRDVRFRAEQAQYTTVGWISALFAGFSLVALDSRRIQYEKAVVDDETLLRDLVSKFLLATFLLHLFSALVHTTAQFVAAFFYDHPRPKYPSKLFLLFDFIGDRLLDLAKFAFIGGSFCMCLVPLWPLQGEEEYQKTFVAVAWALGFVFVFVLIRAQVFMCLALVK